MQKEIVVILGASDKADRYSYQAFHLLKKYGHQPVLVHPNLKEVEGTPVLADLKLAKKAHPKIDTLTLYVNPNISEKAADDIVALKPRRVIFNPGTENYALMSKLEDAGIETEEACTLVLLRTNQY